MKLTPSLSAPPPVRRRRQSANGGAVGRKHAKKVSQHCLSTWPRSGRASSAAPAFVDYQGYACLFGNKQAGAANRGRLLILALLMQCLIATSLSLAICAQKKTQFRRSQSNQPPGCPRQKEIVNYSTHYKSHRTTLIHLRCTH